MMRLLSVIYFFVLAAGLQLPISISAQTHNAVIEQFRKQYIADLRAEPRAPVKPGDFKYLRFFAIDERYKVVADFRATPGSKPFLIATHSGKNKPFREYGTLTFTLHDTSFTLHAYQNLDLINDNTHKADLFIPFTDETNYATTFAGGRYIDLLVSDIVNNQIELDFNKAYNPYCAYTEGFSCPIPPSENYLNTSIPVGEKLFAKNIE